MRAHTSHIAWIRLVIVTLQCLALALAPVVPVKLPMFWDTAALAVLLFVPSVAFAGVGHLRTLTLAIWLAVCTAIVAGLMFHLGSTMDQSLTGLGALLTLFVDCLFVALVLLVGHWFVVAGDSDRRWIARPSTYAATGVRLAIQALLAALAVFLFWSAVVAVGKGLDGIGRPMENAGQALAIIAIPLTVLVGSIVFHALDARMHRSQGA